MCLFFLAPFCFFLSLSFHWIRAPAFKYSGAAEGSLKSTVPLLVITSPSWNVVPHCLSVLLQNQGGRDEPLLRRSSRSYRRALFLYPGRVLAFFSAGWFICSLRWIRFFSVQLLCAQRFLSLYLFSRLVIPVPSVVLLLDTYLSPSFFFRIASLNDSWHFQLNLPPRHCHHGLSPVRYYSGLLSYCYCSIISNMHMKVKNIHKCWDASMLSSEFALLGEDIEIVL